MSSKTSRLRIVAGSARGRFISGPDGAEARPTANRVREATFNALGSLDVVVGARVIDFFAGSGALGLEALSRGAEHVTFVEQDRGSAQIIKDNIRTLGFGARARVVTGNALEFARSMEAMDLALCDPPYGFDKWEEFLTNVRAEMIVIEADRELDLHKVGELVRHKRYGSTFVSIVSTLSLPHSE